MKRVAVYLGLLLCVAANATAEVDITTRNPRPFGYVVGDTLEQELILTVTADQTLDEKKLPKPARLNAWLELRGIHVTETSATAGKIYRVKLLYQFPNAPIEVRVVELPAQRFIFSKAEKLVEVKSTAWPITIGPITPEEVLARDGLEAMRPDVVPQGIDTAPFRQRLIAYGAALTALILFWCYRHFGIPYLATQRRPFTRTYRELDRLARRPAPAAFAQAIERLHQALNETAGKSLFIENIEQFLVHRPIQSDLATMTQQFFQLSRDEFFGVGVPDAQRSLTWMLDFCRAWREVERGAA